jgi:hypothetical protein
MQLEERHSYGFSRVSDSTFNHQKLPAAVRVSFLRRSSEDATSNRVSIPDFLRVNQIAGEKCDLCE